MKVIAAIYSLLLGIATLVVWITHFIIGGLGEQLLPDFIWYFITLPTSLVLEELVEMVPGAINNPIAILLIMTGLAAIQASSVWLIAARLRFSAP